MSKGLEALKVLVMSSTTIFNTKEQIEESVKTIEKELKALEILIKWYKPWIIHDLCCFGADDEEIALVKEILNEH